MTDNDVRIISFTYTQHTFQLLLSNEKKHCMQASSMLLLVSHFNCGQLECSANLSIALFEYLSERIWKKYRVIQSKIQRNHVHLANLYQYYYVYTLSQYFLRKCVIIPAGVKSDQNGIVYLCTLCKTVLISSIYLYNC